MKVFYIIFCLIFSLPLSAQDKYEPVHSFFLIGDCGEPYIGKEVLGKVFSETIKSSGTQNTVLYLGDNIYPKGMPEQGHRLRNDAEHVMNIQASWSDLPQTKTYFIPGNHDWAHWGRKGIEYINHQQGWLDSLHRTNIQLQPRDGCPGPVEIPVTEKVTLVIIDTQWLIHQWEKPGEESSCEAKSTDEVLLQISDIFFRNRYKRIVLAGHHPLITYGEHGGVFPLKAHLFPLTDLSKHLYIPLPIVGSIYPLYRKWFGHIQDTKHPEYRIFSEGIQKILAEYPGSVYVSGHEHALEHIVKDSVHMIISGSGAKVEMVKKKGFAKYADDVRGFVKGEVRHNGEITFSFVSVNPESGNEQLVYQFNVPAILEKSSLSIENIDFSNQFVKIKASDQYNAGKTKRSFLGENYRKEWSQEIEVPVFDIGREKGGLKILKRGGGQQTLSLRLEDSTGHEYVIRSIEKYPEAAVPEMLRKTFAQDLVQDQISASHPYASIVVSHLAEAAGIYHTNPKIFFIPDDPRFGDYQKLFANTLVVFEERPAGDWREAENFGNSKKIINTAKVLEELKEDNDNKVDQEFVLKSRLFDMIIGDWDRHDDQWRWATFKESKGDLYRPIPRDRDQAFFVNEGRISKLWSRKWALPKFEGFDEDIDWPSGLAFNARYFDRSFLNELNRDQWRKIAEQIKNDLTDDEIINAFKNWPREIFNLHGERIIRNIKSRRDAIVNYALSHYDFLAKEVEIATSDKSEFIEVIHQHGNADVSIFKRNKHGEKGKMIYHRIFSPAQTKQVRIFSQGGDDIISVSGKGREKITISFIGGEGKDVVQDSTKHKKTIVYDLKNGVSISTPSSIKGKLSTNNDVNEYDRKSFKYDRLAPLVYANYNFDDGVFIGAGFIHIKHGFRKEPFKARHIFLGSFAPQTMSFNFQYDATFTEVLGKWNLDVSADLKSPNYVNNFFGLGNESQFDRNIDEQPGVSVDHAIQYYRYRFEELLLQPSFTKQLFNGATFSIGPLYQRIEMEKPSSDQDRYIKEFASGLAYNLFDEYNSYAGVGSSLTIDKRNHRQLTTRGTLLKLNAKTMEGVSRGTKDFSSFNGSLAFYHSFRIPSPVVFAVRAGGGRNMGHYEFYQAQILDGKTEVRGLRKTRFYGDSEFYSNAEVRIKLRSFRTYLFPASLGINFFHDVGRVWYKDSTGKDPSAKQRNSDVWHRGFGGGIWFTPFNMTVISAEAAKGDDGYLAYVRLGFLF